MAQEEDHDISTTRMELGFMLLMNVRSRRRRTRKMILTTMPPMMMVMIVQFMNPDIVAEIVGHFSATQTMRTGIKECFLLHCC